MIDLFLNVLLAVGLLGVAALVVGALIGAVYGFILEPSLAAIRRLFARRL